MSQSEFDYDALAEKVAERIQAPDRPLLSAQGLAERLGISLRTARALIETGAVASFKVGGSRRVDPSEVDRYVARLKGAEDEGGTDGQ